MQSSRAGATNKNAMENGGAIEAPAQSHKTIPSPPRQRWQQISILRKTKQHRPKVGGDFQKCRPF